MERKNKNSWRVVRNIFFTLNSFVFFFFILEDCCVILNKPRDLNSHFKFHLGQKVVTVLVYRMVQAHCYVRVVRLSDALLLRNDMNV